MKTKKDGFPKAGKHYTQEEINLILSLPPTHTNINNLAAALGRNHDAIEMIYIKAYSHTLLKDSIKDARGENTIIMQIARAKKELGMFVGYSPKD